MSSPNAHHNAVAEVAAEWREPDHPPRANAVADTVDAPNRWTEEALNYALNRWMQRLTVEALIRWLGDVAATERITVGVLHGSSDPFEGVREAVAVWISGHTYLGHVPEASPALLPAFAGEVAEHHAEVPPEFVSRDGLFGRADAVMAQPDRGEVESFHERCGNHGIPESRRFVRPALCAVGVLDGNESEDIRNRLAEDLLLYEGGGHRRLALLWAPQDFPPDPYLEAMARFRGAFPGHPDTPGALQMQKAFLEAHDEPHAYAEGLQFLVSRGAPEPQPPGHVRWSEYEDLDDVRDWIQEKREDLSAVVARESLHDRLPDTPARRTPGGLHTPPLDDEGGVAIATFVRSLPASEELRKSPGTPAKSS